MPNSGKQVADAVNEVPLSIAPETEAPAVEGSTGAAVDPTTAITQESADVLVGMAEADATQAAESKGWVVRIGSRDGEDFALTMDYRTDRVTLTVKADKVTAVVLG